MGTKYEGLSYAPDFWHKYFSLKETWHEVYIDIENAINSELYDWIDASVTGDWIGTGQYWLFERDVDATHFRLRWL